MLVESTPNEGNACVSVPPEKLEINGPDQAKVGDTVLFNCKSSASHPEAKLEWLIDGEQYHEHTQKDSLATDGTGIIFSFLTVVQGVAKTSRPSEKILPG